MDTRAPLRFTCKEGESPKSLWAFPSCLINTRMKLINMKMPFLFFAVFHFRHNSPEMRKQTLRVLLRSPRPPSAAAVSRCRVSALAAWRTSRCWRPSWGPISAVTSCMWWTPGPRSAHCEKQPDSVFLHVQVGCMFSSCALSAGCACNKSLGNTPPVWLWGYVTWLAL